MTTRKAPPRVPGGDLALADVTAMLVGETWMAVTPGTAQVRGAVVAWVNPTGAPCEARWRDVAVWQGTPPAPPEP